jgi:hypothetical protein
MIIEFRTEPFNEYIKGALEGNRQFRVDKTLVFCEYWDMVCFTCEQTPVIPALDYCRTILEPLGIVITQAEMITRTRLM